MRHPFGSAACAFCLSTGVSHSASTQLRNGQKRGRYLELPDVQGLFFPDVSKHSCFWLFRSNCIRRFPATCRLHGPLSTERCSRCSELVDAWDQESAPREELVLDTGDRTLPAATADIAFLRVDDRSLPRVRHVSGPDVICVYFVHLVSGAASYIEMAQWNQAYTRPRPFETITIVSKSRGCAWSFFLIRASFFHFCVPYMESA